MRAVIRPWERIIRLMNGVGFTHLQFGGGSVVMQALRWKNQWFVVRPRPNEPERQTLDIAWLRLKGSTNPVRQWFEEERKVARLLANVASE